MSVFDFMETFFFISLGITFILILLLVYHFKDRLNNLEQKCDTMFEIINNMVREMTSIKSTVITHLSGANVDAPTALPKIPFLGTGMSMDEHFKKNNIHTLQTSEQNNISIINEQELNAEESDSDSDEESDEESDAESDAESESDSASDAGSDSDADSDADSDIESEPESDADADMEELAPELALDSIEPEELEPEDLKLEPEELDQALEPEPNTIKIIKVVVDAAPSDNSQKEAEVVSEVIESLKETDLTPSATPSTNASEVPSNSFTKVPELARSPTLTFGSRLAPIQLSENVEESIPVENRFDRFSASSDESFLVVHKINSDSNESEEPVISPKKAAMETYSKMNTNALKAIVISKGLATDLQKYKKPQLLQLLESSFSE